MPVSVCDPVRSALLENLSTSENSRDSLDRQIVTSAKRVLMTHIEYEETSTFQTNNLDSLKCKYIILNPNRKTQEKEVENGQGGNKEVLLPEPKKILFPREAVQLGWQNNRRWNAGSGMMNMGNTCYLNSTLQALFHVPCLANWLVSDSSHSELCEDNGGGQGGCIICAMSKTLTACQNSSGPIKPWLVYSKLRFVCRHLVPGRQEDAHEFLRYLVEAMEKSYLARIKGSKDLDQYSKETTPLNQILGGYLRSTVRCLSCGHVSITFQHFQDLLLDIRKANTLDEALESYFARERLEDMGYRCEACKRKVSATKQFSLERAPSVLCIQLKRFSMMGNKINKHIVFSSKLDISKFSCKSNSTALTYRLVAMVTHIGSSQNCGHYTAIGQSSDGAYYQFDDSSVRSLPLQSVLSTNAYIMLYEMEKTSSSSSHTAILQSTSNSSSINNHNKSISETLNGMNTKNSKIFTPTLKPFTNSMNSSVALTSTENIESTEIKKGFIGPVLPPNYKTSSNDHKSSNDDKNPSQSISKSPLISTARTLITSGSKLVQQNENRSMPLLNNVSDSHKKHSVENVLAHKSPALTNGSYNSKSVPNINKPQIDSVNKQIQHLRVNGHSSNTATTSHQNIKSLVPYDGSDDSNSEIDSAFNSKRQEIVINTKATIPGWKVSSAKNPALLSPSLHGEAGWSPKKKINSDSEKSSLTTNGSSDTVSQLLRMSHQGYSAPVTSWNGGRSHLEKEIADERREQRKRPVDDMDRGRTKKVKSFHYQGRDNPGYNPFQEYQNSSRQWNGHQGNGRPSFNNHHRNGYHNNHRGAPYRGRHRSHHQRHGYNRR